MVPYSLERHTNLHDHQEGQEQSTSNIDNFENLHKVDMVSYRFAVANWP